MPYKFKPIKPKRPVGGDYNRILAALTGAMRDTVTIGQREMAKYPTQVLKDTGYRRTNTLKRSWSSLVKVGAGMIQGIVGSNAGIAPYNKWVQGKKQTELFGRTGWMNVDMLIKRMRINLVERAQAAISKAVK